MLRNLGISTRGSKCSFASSALRRGFFRDLLGLDTRDDPSAPSEENRFFPMDQSPIEAIRKRAAFIKARARCPVTGGNINFVCPKSGVPTHQDEDAWKSDTEYWNAERWKLLKKANMYEHDLRSGREFPELEFPGSQESDQVVNFFNWDTFFYTRDFYSMDNDFNLAIVTKVLSYPLTIGSILTELSPYHLKPKGPLTLEGLKSAAALRYTLFPVDRSLALQDRPMRFFILGARMESQLPYHAWLQLSFLLPNVNFELIFIGPESNYDRRRNRYVQLDVPFKEHITPNVSLKYYTNYFHVLNDMGDFFPYDPYLDAFFMFHPGLGAPEAMDQWVKSVPGLLESKCPIYVTGFHDADLMQDWSWLNSNFAGEFDVLIEPTSNRFRSTKWEFNDLNPQELYQLNQKIFGFRGKRYHISHV